MWEAGGDYNNLLVQAISSEVKPTGLSPGTTTLSGLGTVTISSTGLVVTQTSNGYVRLALFIGYVTDEVGFCLELTLWFGLVCIPPS